MGLASVRQFADAFNEGRTHFCSFRKVPSQSSLGGMWVDLSMTAGNPVPNYYASAPLEANTLDGMRGIFHGDDKAPATKHLASWGIGAASIVGRFTLCDYLLYYPFVDGDDTEAQTMDNSTAALSRYTDGEGVMVMAVNVAPPLGGGTFTMTYINQDGVEKTSPPQVCSATAGFIASLTTSHIFTSPPAGGPPGPFLLLANGDRGVRQINSVQFTSANGGLIALVLVKPIADTANYEVSTVKEVSYVHTRPGAPQIHDGAYLGLLFNCSGSISGFPIAGYMNFIWST